MNINLQSNYNNSKINENIFCIILSLYIIIGTANNSLFIGENKFITNPDFFYNIKIYFFPIALTLQYIINKRNNFTHLIAGIIFLVACLMITINSDTHYIISLGGFILSGLTYNLNPKKIAKVTYLSIFFVTVIIFVASQTGIIYDAINDNRFGRVGHYFGFYWYTYLPTNILFSWIIYRYAKEKKASLIEIILFSVLSYIIFYYSTHRLGFYLSIIVIIMHIVFAKYELIKINNKLIKFLSAIGFFVSSIITILLSLLYNDNVKILSKIDSLLNGRLHLGKIAFERYKIKLLGQKIILHENGTYFLIDSGYIHILLAYGVLLFILIMLMYTFLHWKSCKLNNKTLFIWVTAQMIYTMINNVWIDLESGSCLLIAAIMIRNEYIEHKKCTNNILLKNRSIFE